MIGIRKKIVFGFVSLAVLLFFSGIISLVELRRLTNQMEDLLDSSASNMGFTREMLDALHAQNIAIMDKELGRSSSFDSVYAATTAMFDAALEKATVTVRDRTELEAIYEANDAFEAVISEMMLGEKDMTVHWFSTAYRNAYDNLSSALKDYMITLQEKVKTRASMLGNTAYRAITPGIMALGVGIFILLMFLYLIDLYFVLPVVRINKSLKGYLTSRVPFQVKMEGADEVAQLKEGIEDLITLSKNKKPE